MKLDKKKKYNKLLVFYKIRNKFKIYKQLFESKFKH